MQRERLYHEGVAVGCYLSSKHTFFFFVFFVWHVLVVCFRIMNECESKYIFSEVHRNFTIISPVLVLIWKYF